MADFPSDKWAGIPPTQHIDDRTQQPGIYDWWTMWGLPSTPTQRVEGAFNFFEDPIEEFTASGRGPGDPLQLSLGWDDILKYRPDGVRSVVTSLRDAKKKLPKKKAGGK